MWKPFASTRTAVERITPMIRFSLRNVEVKVDAMRQDTPPGMASISDEIAVDTDEPDRHLELLHDNAKRHVWARRRVFVCEGGSMLTFR